MRTPDASGPVRTCVGCRRRRPVEALLRLTRSSDGIAVDGSSDGRGAWLCRDEGVRGRIDRGCAETALARRAFERAWHLTIDHDDRERLGEQIREHIAAFGHDGPAVEGDSGRMP